MGIFERFGVKPIINAAGTETRFAGALMDKEALAAMQAAAHMSVRIDELQAAASKVIAAKTHAEAGIVTNGASAALTLATAACLCGFNVARMNRLPDTRGIPNEVIMPRHQISGYSHAITAAGAKIIGAGIPNDTPAPDEVHIIRRWDIEAAITEKTTAIACASQEGDHPPLAEIIDIAKSYEIPVIIDAAAQVPPVKNLHRYIDMGADLVCISGGKGIRGPQNSGILCGRKDLVASAVIQMLDMAGKPFGSWDPPASLIPKDKLRGRPEHGIGRGFKVSKEVVVGLLVALQNLTEASFAEQAAHLKGLLVQIKNRIKDIHGVTTRLTEEEPAGFPLLEVFIDAAAAGKTATEVAKRLRSDRVFLRETYSDFGRLIIHPINLDSESAGIVGESLHAALAN